MSSSFCTILILSLLGISLTYAEPSKETRVVELAKPIDRNAEFSPHINTTKVVVGTAKPASLKDVVTEPVFDQPQQNLQAIINAKPIVKPRRPTRDDGAMPSRGQDLGQTEQAPILAKDNSSFTNAKELDRKKYLVVQQPKIPEAFIMLDSAIAPGTSTRLAWMPGQSFKGITIPTPVLVVNGSKPGPAVCLTAAIHGDELNGIEIIRRVLYELDAKALSGTVIGVPIVNLQGFQRQSRYLIDRRDLNRFFPGDSKGSSAARLAYSFFNEVIVHCDFLIDLHTGSFYRTNLPQLRVNTDSPEALDFAKQFGATIIVHGEGSPGTLRRAAVDAGIPAVTLETGESMRLQEAAVEHGVKGIETLLEQKNMLSSLKFWKTTEAIYHQSMWVRADQGGILFSKVKPGAHVDEGHLLGVVTDPITNMSSNITAPFKGRVIGLALNQVVMPGFAIFHLGMESGNQMNPDANGGHTPAVEERPPAVEEDGEDVN